VEIARARYRYEGGAAALGLAIGNLTSQWSANLVLGRIDRFVLEGIGASGDVRDMDDFVLFADEKRALGAARAATGVGPQGSAKRVNRGGSLDNAASNARSANRNHDTPENWEDYLGLRLRLAKAPHRPNARTPLVRLARDAEIHCLCRGPGGPAAESNGGDDVPSPSHSSNDSRLRGTSRWPMSSASSPTYGPLGRASRSCTGAAHRARSARTRKSIWPRTSAGQRVLLRRQVRAECRALLRERRCSTG